MVIASIAIYDYDRGRWKRSDAVNGK